MSFGQLSGNSIGSYPGLVITPFDEKSVQPASYDLHISDHFLVQASSTENVAYSYDYPVVYDEIRTSVFMLSPGDFCLATTTEYFEIPNTLAARIEGKSTWGRLGLLIHCTAGFVDPGFKGNLTMEISNISNNTIELIKDQPIAQITFVTLDSDADPYGTPRFASKYQHQRSTTAPFSKAVNLPSRWGWHGILADLIDKIDIPTHRFIVRDIEDVIYKLAKGMPVTNLEFNAILQKCYNDGAIDRDVYLEYRVMLSELRTG